MIDGCTAFISPGSGELILIMLALILLFGAKDAPRILRSIQSILDKIQRTAADFRYQIMYGDLAGGGDGGTKATEAEDDSHYDEPPEDAEWVDEEEEDALRPEGQDGKPADSESPGTKAESDAGQTAQRSAGS